MSRLVMKFGGTSVANIERIRNVARHVKREVDAGHDVAVVVSAMAGKTNELVDWCREASPMHDAREYDAVVASGEQVTAGLFAVLLQGPGSQARSRTCLNWPRKAPRCCRSARWNSAWCTTCRSSSGPVSTNPKMSTRTPTSRRAR